MIVILAFAFLSGIVTILSPCILPLLPVILSGSVGGGRARSIGVVTGFVISFTIFTLTLTTIVRAIGIPSDTLRIFAVVIIIMFGCVMIVPKLGELFERFASRIAAVGRNGSRPIGADKTSRLAGFGGGLLLGVTIGLVWTPCVGPIMASVITLALTQRVDGGAALITIAYTLGTVIPMLAIIIGGRALFKKVPVLTRNTGRIRKVFGVLMIVIGISIGFGLDRQFQFAVLSALPGYGSGLTTIEDNPAVTHALAKRSSTMETTASSNKNVFTQGVQPENGVLGFYGDAPEIVTKENWFNTGTFPNGRTATVGTSPLTMADLKGKVVLVDFWTYSCINCVRTIPFLKSWYDKYKKDGFVIVGIHTPEFEFEKSGDNVLRAIKDLGVEWPVVQDNNYEQWSAYSNRYWPAHYFIDVKGRVRYFHFGEGDYDVSERVIRALLAEAGISTVTGKKKVDEQTLSTSAPETYLGYGNIRSFMSGADFMPDKTVGYSLVPLKHNGEWTIGGNWTIAKEYSIPETEGTLRLSFEAKNIFLVIEPVEPGGTIQVSVDGKPGSDTRDVTKGILSPSQGRLYELVRLKEPGAHVLELLVKGKLRLYSFTFG